MVRSPFSPKRCFLSLAIWIGLSSISCFAHPVFLVVDWTPYDNQMARVWPILAASATPAAGPISLVDVNRCMIKLHRFRYRYSIQWETPEEVKFSRVADCKGKAMTLYEEMAANGAENFCLIIGKRHPSDTRTHVWLEWSTARGNYVLDPTFNWVAAKRANLSSKMYIPLYAYQGAEKFRAMNAPFFTQN